MAGFGRFLAGAWQVLAGVSRQFDPMRIDVGDLRAARAPKFDPRPHGRRPDPRTLPGKRNPRFRDRSRAVELSFIHVSKTRRPRATARARCSISADVAPRGSRVDYAICNFIVGGATAFLGNVAGSTFVVRSGDRLSSSGRPHFRVSLQGFTPTQSISATARRAISSINVTMAMPVARDGWPAGAIRPASPSSRAQRSVAQRRCAGTGRVYPEKAR